MLLIKKQTTEMYYVMVKTFHDSIAYFTRVYMICLILPSTSQLALTG